MTTPYRTDNAELTDFAEELGLRVLGCYHHPDIGRDTVFAKCPSCGKQGHYSGIEKVTKCGCDLKAHSLLKRDVEAIDKSSKEYRAWIRMRLIVRRNKKMLLHPDMDSFRLFRVTLGLAPSNNYILSIPMVPDNTSSDDLPLIVGIGDGCDLILSWRFANHFPPNRLPFRYFTDNSGVSKTAADWSKITGIRARLIRARVTDKGWTDHDAIHTPSRSRVPRVLYRDEKTGISRTASGWSRLYGIALTTLYERLTSGRPVSEVLDECRR